MPVRARPLLAFQPVPQLCVSVPLWLSLPVHPLRQFAHDGEEGHGLGTGRCGHDAHRVAGDVDGGVGRPPGQVEPEEILAVLAGQAGARLCDAWLVSPSGKVLSASGSVEAAPGAEQQVTLGPVMVAEQGEYSCTVRIADPVTKAPLAYRKVACSNPGTIEQLTVRKDRVGDLKEFLMVLAVQREAEK